MYTNTLETQFSKSAIHGSFVLEDIEFALPVKAIQEVVNEPRTYETMPFGPDYAIGLMNLRGLVIPVVDLRILFEIEHESRESAEANKIAIIEDGGFCIGLLFTDTRDVFNASHVPYSQIEFNGSNSITNVLKGVFKLENGKRLVHVLDVDGLFSLNEFPKSVIGNETTKVTEQGVRRQCISFGVNEAKFSLDINIVKETIAYEAIDNKILSSALCLGAIDLRGETIPIVKFSELIGGDDYDENIKNQRIIIIQNEESMLGLLVDSIDSIVTYFESKLVTYPDLSNDTHKLFEGSIKDTASSMDIVLINHTNLLANSKIVEITQGHGALFQSVNNKDKISEIDGNAHLNYQSYITFSLDTSYALDINDVKEVIEQPDQLMAAPSTCTDIKGMFNLRGEMITLVDFSSLSAEKNQTDQNTEPCTKVIIYECNNVKYGLMARSVDSIVRHSGNDTLDLPKSLSRSSNDEDWKIGNAVKKALNFEGKMICILDLERITEKVCA